MTILEELAAYARERVATEEKLKSLAEVRREAEALPQGNFPFLKALAKPELSFICECKKASPSKGLIAPDFPYLSIAKTYEEAGASCISVLTEPKWFLGSDRYLEEIAVRVQIPCLRKDFTVAPYMIYQAKNLGASAVLLICSILDKSELQEYLELAHSLGMNAVVEAHDAQEVETALEIGAGIIGVNNRNLKDFTVDTGNSAKLRSLIPKEVKFISESGIKTGADVLLAKHMGADAVLVGEALMRSKDVAATLKEWRSL